LDGIKFPVGSVPVYSAPVQSGIEASSLQVPAHGADGFVENSPVKETNRAIISFPLSGVKEKNSIGSSELAKQASDSAVAASCAAIPSPLAEGLLHIDVIYTNDIHGAITPKKDENDPDALSGGVSYLGSVVRRLQQESGGNYILLDSGDWGQGSYESKLTKGKTLIDVMNSLHYDAAEIGNHEFDWGQDALKEMVDRAQFPVLGANILQKGNLLQGVRPYTIKEIGGFKCGIMGVISQNTPSTVDGRNIVGLEFQDPRQAVKKYLPEMKKLGVDFIIFATHEGLMAHGKLASAFPEIGVIAAGHDHEATPQVKQSGDTLIVETGTGGVNVGKLSLTIDPVSKKVLHFENRLIPVTSKDTSPDPEIEKIIGPLVAEAGVSMKGEVGTSAVDLTHDRKHVLESVMGNVVTDALREATGADIAMSNSGGIRDQIMAGDITVGDLYRVLPFDKLTATMDLTGAQIKELLENSAARRKGNLQFSGLKMDVEPRKAKGHKTSNIMVNGEPLELAKTYRVATDDFLAGGGGGFETFTQGKNVTYGDVTVETLKAYLKKHSPLTMENAKIEGRTHYLSPPPEPFI
jgi:2',3'-cyclic-nucleotide 2'-phosphodiesterase (5'-nucleotidase family)